jgi:hypothetical protein
MNPLSMQAPNTLHPALYEEWNSPNPRLPVEAHHGLAGLAARSMAPYSEAELTTILLHFLTAFSNLIGSAPHCRTGQARHNLNLFLILVGKSGTSCNDNGWRQISSLFAEVDPDWAACRILTAPPTVSRILKTLCEQRGDDRRLFLMPQEFGSVLNNLTRENSPLAPLLRCAWEGGEVAGPGGEPPIQGFLAHIGLAGHLTQTELAPLLGRAELHKVFAHRCLWASVQRSQFLPDGGTLPPQDRAAIVQQLHHVNDWIRDQPELVFARTPEAGELWNRTYADLTEIHADAHVLRLSALYAALDATPYIDGVHLRAALAVWNYCRASSLQLFRRRTRFV